MATYWDYGVATLFGMMAIYWALIYAIIRRLKRDHLAKYVEMGEPKMIFRHPRSDLATIRFLARREHLTMHDVHLSRLSDLALICFFSISAVIIVFAVGPQQ